MGPEVTVYEIDADDRIRRVDDGWLDFARRNDGPELVREKVLGRELWSFVEGRELRLLYRSLIDSVRRTRLGASVPFRCDAPEEARSMRLQIDPIGAGNAVRFEATT